MISTPPAREASPPGGERRWYQRVFDGNGLLWVLYFTFIILSIFTVSSAISSDFYKSLSSGGFNPIAKHWVMLFMGVCTAIVMSSLPAKYYRVQVPWLLLFVVLVLTGWLLFAGVSRNGAERWIDLGFITIQPSEFVRVLLVLFGALTAQWAYSRRKTESQRVLLFYIYWIFFGVLCLVLSLGNLSTGLILLSFLFVYSWVLKAPRRALLRFAGLGLGLGLLFVLALFTLPDSLLPGRATTWRNRLERAVSTPEERFRITDENRQEQMGRIAIARGQTPHGPGKSKIRDTLAMAYSDYLYAIIIEEYSFLGLLLIPGLYLCWMYLALREARKQTNTYRSNLLRGFGILYPMQAIVNMIVASGIISTGQTLPLLSYGGSSIIAVSMSFGIMIGASRVDKDKRLKPTEATVPAEGEDPTHNK